MAGMQERVDQPNIPSDQNLLDRDYLTIGIGNVFVSTSPEDRTEWIGTIKATAADFVVREVSLDGLVADLSLTAEDIPQHSSTKKRKADDITKEAPHIADTRTSTQEDLSVILTQAGHAAEELVVKLQALDQIAKGSTSELIPPESPVLINSMGDKTLRTQLHVALSTDFPLLDSQTTGGNAIQVSIDSRFDSLKKYLQYPVEDLSQLSKFYRHVIPNQSIRLRLKEGLPRCDRRPVHRIIDEKFNRMLRTTTVDGAIEVSWAKRRSSRPQELTLCVLRKIGFEHTAMMAKLSKTLHCRRHQISVAGIKDMMAETFQFCVVGGNRRPPAVHNENVDLIPLGPVSKQLERGELRGNRFEIVVRNLRRKSGEELSEEVVVRRISLMSQFVNFFGEQRVGEPGDSAIVGVRAPDIGRAMLQRNYHKAIDLIMTGRRVIGGKVVEPDQFRRVWKESNGDAVATCAVSGLPAKERTLLNGLKRYNDPLAALRCLPFHDRMLYINAYQSLVWNHAATERIRLYGCRVAEGDLVVEDGSASRQVEVVEPGKETSYRLSQVVLPLPGWGIVYPRNEVSQVYTHILSDDSVEFAKDTEGSVKGAYRRLISDTQQAVKCHKVQDTGSDYRVSFELRSGSYATIFLREILHTTSA